MKKSLMIFGLILLAASCGSSSSSGAPSATPIPAGANTVLIPNGAFTGNVQAFNPSPLTVAVGTTVTFGNNDNTTHTSTADGGAWNSNNLNPGGTFSVQLNTAGTYTYHCTIHSFMTGKIVVQ